MRVTGVDAARGGWVAVDLAGGAFAGVRFARSLAALLRDAAPDRLVAIDMPLGLLDHGWRAADRLAQDLLGPRRSCVFTIPPRPVWREPSYPAANQRCRELTGRGMSAQTWGLRTRLREADDYRRSCPHPLFEVHPELSFLAMAGVAAIDGKHTQIGQALRRRLLTAAGIVLPVRLAGVPTTATVDVIDATAVAWSAQRIATGRACVVPDPPERAPDGREIAIRY